MTLIFFHQGQSYKRLKNSHFFREPHNTHVVFHEVSDYCGLRQNLRLSRVILIRAYFTLLEEVIYPAKTIPLFTHIKVNENQPISLTLHK